MGKKRAALLVALLAPAAAGAAVFGPHAAACQGRGPAMLVRVEGLKTRGGTVRVQSYGGDPHHFFDKGTYLERVEFHPPAGGPVEVCLPVARPGGYAVSVRHDVNDDRKIGRLDGGGLSGNPEVSLMDVVFKRRPPPAAVLVAVKGVTPVPVTMNYVQGLSFGPIAEATR